MYVYDPPLSLSLEQGVNVTLLHMAARNNHTAVAALLLDQGAAVDW